MSLIERLSDAVSLAKERKKERETNIRKLEKELEEMKESIRIEKSKAVKEVSNSNSNIKLIPLSVGHEQFKLLFTTIHESVYQAYCRRNEKKFKEESIPTQLAVCGGYEVKLKFSRLVSPYDISGKEFSKGGKKQLETLETLERALLSTSQEFYSQMPAAHKSAYLELNSIRPTEKFKYSYGGRFSPYDMELVASKLEVVDSSFTETMSNDNGKNDHNDD